MKIFFVIIFTILFNIKYVHSKENFFDINFAPKDIGNIVKHWEYKSGIFKTSQTKPEIFQEKVIFLDGFKNLRVVSLLNGKEVCVNFAKKGDRGPQRGIGIFKKTNKDIYAVFFRHRNLKMINIKNCKEIKLKKNIEIKYAVSTKILIDGNKAFILINGAAPRAYDLLNGKLIWKASLKHKDNIILQKKNSYKKFQWNVWGGGFLDKKYNQIIFSTANPKPAFVSKGREGNNLFSNSVVSIDMNTGKYKWHFQEISHDLMNLDHASPPAPYSNNGFDYVVQATKSGQLIVLNRENGHPKYEYVTKKFEYGRKKNEITIQKIFDHWLHFSKMEFEKNDINEIKNNYSLEAKNILKKSLFGDNKKLIKSKNYIFYGMHGGAEWPGISISPEGYVAIPSNNIAWIGRLKDPLNYDFKKSFNTVYKNFKLLILGDEKKIYLKKIYSELKKLSNFYKIDIDKYQRFISKNNIPLNKPPWGLLTLIDLKNEKKLWQVPHGSYNFIDKNLIDTGAEVFGSPIITRGGVIFLAGTEDKKIRAYNLNNGNEIWNDQLPYVSYGRLSYASYNGKNYLLVMCTGGSKFKNSETGDTLIAYKLNL